MHNKVSCLFLCFLLLVICLTSCGDSPSTPQETETPVVSSAPTEKPDMPPLMESSEAELEDANFVLKDWLERSTPAYDIVAGMIALEKDSDGRVIPLTLKEHTGSYFKVIDSRYSSIEDLKKVINSVCTESGAKAMGINGWEALYTEEDGQLYCLHADLPFGFDPDWSAEIVGIVKKSDDILVLRVPCDLEYSQNDGQFSDLTFVKENDTWLFSNQQVY